MNQVVYEQLELSLRKNLFIFVCLENKTSSSLKFRLDYYTSQVQKNNVFVNTRGRGLYLTIYNIILYLYICLKIYLYILEIILYKFVNRFIQY